MVAQPIEIEIDPESETGRLLALARRRPVHLTSGSEKFHLVHDEGDAVREDPFANYDPERAVAALRTLANANIFEGIDIEELKRDLKEQRGQHSIGRPEW